MLWSGLVRNGQLGDLCKDIRSSMKYFRASSHVRWLNGEWTKRFKDHFVPVVRESVPGWREQMVLETLVHSPLNHVTRLLARKYCIKFSRRTSCRLCHIKSCGLCMSVVCLPSRCIHDEVVTLYRGADKSLARPGRKQARKHVRDARDFNIETRAVIKLFFFPLQGKAPKEIRTILSADGNSHHSDRNIGLFPSWSG